MTQKPHRETTERQAIATAKQEVIELRMRYTQATDLIGTGRPEAVAAGREIYQQIYTADARIGADGIDQVSGPEAWGDIVEDALESYTATQHLVGSALVTSLTLPDAAGQGGTAELQSYLQGWHSTANNSLYMYIGTYRDRCVYSNELGWQIAHMHLSKTADEIRDITPR